MCPLLLAKKLLIKSSSGWFPVGRAEGGSRGQKEREGACRAARVASVLGHKVKVPETWAWKLQFLQLPPLLLLRGAKGRGALRHK